MQSSCELCYIRLQILILIQKYKLEKVLPSLFCLLASFPTFPSWMKGCVNAFKSCCMLWFCRRLMHFLKHFVFQTDEELDPEDVELDEHYTIETRSKCKIQLSILISFSTNTTFLWFKHRCLFYCEIKKINLLIHWFLKYNAGGKGHHG